eukprot:11107824-Alexandrium_andersonii.AAC.1
MELQSKRSHRAQHPTLAKGLASTEVGDPANWGSGDRRRSASRGPRARKCVAMGTWKGRLSSLHFGDLLT